MFKKNKFINENLIKIGLAFLVSSFLIFFMFMLNKLNGKDYLVYRSDFLQEGIAYLSFFVNSIINHENVFFNFGSGLGVNNIMSIANIVLSPFNILFILFHNFDNNIIALIVIVLKIGCAAASFQYFSHKILKNDKYFSVIISVFYSLNAYSISYGTIEFMWLDALIILPLLISTIIDVMEGKNRPVLIVLYFYLFLAQFYIAYMVSIFTFIFVLLYLLLIYRSKKEKRFKDIMNRFADWLMCVFVSIMLFAFIWSPTLFFILGNRASDSTEIVGLNVSLIQILNSFFWGMSYGIDGRYAYLYCGIPSVILASMFFLNKKINIKEKVFFGVLLGILLFSMVSDKLNVVWHVFDQPDSFWYRYSFLVCFVVCALASRQIGKMEEDDSKKIFLIDLAWLLLYSFVLHTIILWEIDAPGVNYFNSNFGFEFNAALFIVWSLIIAFYNKTFKKKWILVLFAFLFMATELLSFSIRQFPYKKDANAYKEWCSFMQNTVNEIKASDDGFYRIGIHRYDMSLNSDSLFAYNGIEDFGDQEKYPVRRFLSNIGYATSPRVTIENGYNPVSEMLLGVKYNIIAPDTSAIEVNEQINENIESAETFNGFDSTLIYIPDSDKTGYSYNNNALNVGYFVNGDVLLYEYPGRNVFKNMNSLLTALSGIENDVFEEIPGNDVIYDFDGVELMNNGNGYSLISNSDKDVSKIIISVPSKYKSPYIQVEKESPGIPMKDCFITNLENISNCDGLYATLSFAGKMGLDKTDGSRKVAIAFYKDISPDQFECDTINVYDYNEEALIEHYNELSKNQIRIVEYNNGFLRGNVHAPSDKHLLLFTIPYDKGWKAYVNNQEVEIIRLIDGAFIGVLFPGEGDYTVELKYEVPGLKIGVIVSLLGIVAFLSVIFEKKLKNFGKKK